MNKKLLSILAILALVTGSVFAVTASTTEPNAFVFDSITQPTAESTTVVADADQEQYAMELQVNAGGWTPADGMYITDDANWNVREGFTVNFRVLTTAGAMEGDRTLETTLTVGDLIRQTPNGETAHTAGAGTLSLESFGATFMNTSLSGLVFTSSLKEAHVYGESGNEAEDSYEFNIAYAADGTAPAGQYRSSITISYSIT